MSGKAKSIMLVVSAAWVGLVAVVCLWLFPSALGVFGFVLLTLIPLTGFWSEPWQRRRRRRHSR